MHDSSSFFMLIRILTSGLPTFQFSLECDLCISEVVAFRHSSALPTIGSGSHKLCQVNNQGR